MALACLQLKHGALSCNQKRVGLFIKLFKIENTMLMRCVFLQATLQQPEDA